MNRWSGELRHLSQWLARIQRQAHEEGRTELAGEIEQAIVHVDIAADDDASGDPFTGILTREEREEREE